MSSAVVVSTPHNGEIPTTVVDGTSCNENSSAATVDRSMSQTSNPQQQVQQQIISQQQQGMEQMHSNTNTDSGGGGSSGSSAAVNSVQEEVGGPSGATITSTVHSTQGGLAMKNIIKSKIFPFSEDLIRILREVAIQGSSSVVPWKSDDTVWKRPESRTIKEASSRPMSSDNLNRRPQPAPHHHHHHHDYFAGGSTRLGRHSHKRSRMSTISSRHLHSGSSSHRSSTTATSSSSTTTTTMVVMPQQNLPLQSTTTTTSNLFVIRPQASSSSTSGAYPNSLFLPNASSTNRSNTTTASIASYTAASGSEYEDTSQYECDSEGTSATSNSEMSFSSSISRRRNMSAAMGNNNLGSRGNLSSLTIAKRNDPFVRPQYRSVREALVNALTLVLDYYYQNRGGYKLSPFEHCIHGAGSEVSNASKNLRVQEESKSKAIFVPDSEEVFQKRKKRLLDMLSRYCSATAADMEVSDTDRGPTILLHRSHLVKSASPPFTIQRLAEVLLEPERYYSQTHKLCNCIEKLLLVTSSTSAFGGIIGGETSQSRQEDTELVAVSEERKRLRSEFRQRHKKSRRSTIAGETRIKERRANMGVDINETNTIEPGDAIGSGIPDADADDEDDELLPTTSSNTEILDAAARATLRSKFDHVGIDPHSQAAMANSRDVVAMMESRRLNSTSPPPPPLSHNNGLPSQLHPRQSSPLRSSPSPSSSPESSKAMLSPRIPSPLLFHHSNPIYDGSPTLSLLMSPTLSPPMNLPCVQQPSQSHHPSLTLPTTSLTTPNHHHHHHHGTLYHGDSGGSIETQKSSPASSDLDSESDMDGDSDDRSDGSDNEQKPVSTSSSYEPLTAAQAMALNRRHQQARMQSRLLTAAAAVAATQQHQQQSSNMNHTPSSGIMDGYNQRHNHTESMIATATTNANTANTLEYQGSSGDSLDSTRAEDSGGSDSSSSDLAD